MGKSNKKVKNDRINTLRKQYDAYLEEDKKRKERNEFILGKLDKMRSSSALVPILSKATYHQEDLSDIYMRPSNFRKTTNPVYDNYVSHVEPQDVTSDILNKHLDESSILKEISKRYILIPKRRVPIDRVEYAYNNKEALNDDDWRSKYNILENLKQQEKEDQSDIPTNENKEILKRSFKDPEVSYDKQPKVIDNGSNEPSPAVNNNKLNTYHENKINKNVDFKIPENTQSHDSKKMPIQTNVLTNEDLKNDNTEALHNVILTNSSVTHEANQPHQEYIEEKEKYYSDVNEKHLSYEQSPNIDNDMHISEGNNDDQKDYSESIYLANQNESMPESNAYESYDNVNSTSYPEEVTSDVTLQEAAVSEMEFNPSENTENQKDVSKDFHDSAYQDPVMLHADTDKSPSGQLEVQLEVGQTALGTPQEYDTTQDSNPVGTENTEHTEHVVVNHDSEINEFEAEQKEMFYSEQDGGDTYAYNQGDSNTGEYPAEGYEQNDQYAYYEGVQQEQAYATNVNEHEEATERYDPHYDQQYEGTYENQQPDNTTNYENVNTYEQQQYQEGSYENQQFENVVNYENPQENANLYQQENVSNVNEQESVLVPENTEVYDQHLYAGQSETQEHIEQQLVAEEGYIENPPISKDELKPEHEGEIEGIMDITNPVTQMPEPKFS